MAAPAAVVAGMIFGPVALAVAAITSVEGTDLKNSDKTGRAKDAGWALLNKTTASSAVIARSMGDLPFFEGTDSRKGAVPPINPSYVRKLGSFSI